jgi:hypothetical protein
VAARETAVQLGIGHDAMQEMTVTLVYQKICSHWAPHLPMDEHKRHTWMHHHKLLQSRGTESDDFLFNVVTSDESCFHHLNPRMK